MPPKKKSNVNGKEVVKEYMLTANRPYNAQTVFLNLHKAVGKTELVKVMDELCTDGILSKKDYKKARFYWANQEAIGDVSDEKITQLKETVTAAEKENQVLTRECDEKEREAGVLSATPTNSSLSSLLKEAQEEKKTLSKKLQEAKKSGSSTSKTEIRQREKMLEKQVSVWRKRKSIAMDVINSVSEGSGKSPAKIMEEMGVESDEDYNVSLQKMTAVLQPAPKRARIGC